jgi:hypothetical protein
VHASMAKTKGYSARHATARVLSGQLFIDEMTLSCVAVPVLALKR